MEQTDRLLDKGLHYHSVFYGNAMKWDRFFLHFTDKNKVTTSKVMVEIRT